MADRLNKADESSDHPMAGMEELSSLTATTMVSMEHLKQLFGSDFNSLPQKRQDRIRRLYKEERSEEFNPLVRSMIDAYKREGDEHGNPGKVSHREDDANLKNLQHLEFEMEKLAKEVEEKQNATERESAEKEELNKKVARLFWQCRENKTLKEEQEKKAFDLQLELKKMELQLKEKNARERHLQDALRDRKAEESQRHRQSAMLRLALGEQWKDESLTTQAVEEREKEKEALLTQIQTLRTENKGLHGKIDELLLSLKNTPAANIHKITEKTRGEILTLLGVDTHVTPDQSGAWSGEAAVDSGLQTHSPSHQRLKGGLGHGAQHGLSVSFASDHIAPEIDTHAIRSMTMDKSTDLRMRETDKSRTFRKTPQTTEQHSHFSPAAERPPYMDEEWPAPPDFEDLEEHGQSHAAARAPQERCRLFVGGEGAEKAYFKRGDTKLTPTTEITIRPTSVYAGKRPESSAARAPEVTSNGYLLSAAIDIGTSSSCYAFSYSASKTEIRMNKNWSHPVNFQSYKTPTNILTEGGSRGEFLAFGYEAERVYRETVATGHTKKYELYTDFKMVLYREKHVSRGGTMAQSLTGTQRPLMDLYVLTLQYMRDHMLDAIAKTGVPRVRRGDIRWVLCVPATWTDKSKDFLRTAAHKAQLIEHVQSTQLVLVLEATAAALYCQLPDTLIMGSVSAASAPATAGAAGRKYLVIDAGAGTVDFTAQESLPDNQVKEIAIAGGGDFGGRHIDVGFTKLLKQTLGDAFITKFIKEYPVQWFEFLIGFEITKTYIDDGKSINIEIPVDMDRFMQKLHGKHIRDVLETKGKTQGVQEGNGYLRINADTVKRLFDPILTQITDYAQEMIRSNGLRSLDVIYLVGGFAACRLLHTRMMNTFPYLEIAVPMDARAAVVQGAVLYGHDPSMIIRKAKKTYGVSTLSPFDAKVHPESKKNVIHGTPYCDGLLLPFVHKGELLPPGTHGNMVVSPVLAHANNIAVDFYCIDRETPPEEVIYVDSPGVQKHGSVKVDMPNTDGGLKREVTLTFTFNDEIGVEAFDESSGSNAMVTLSFDYDYHKQQS